MRLSVPLPGLAVPFPGLAVLGLAAALLAPAPLLAAPQPEAPDWPCVQRLVPELSTAAVWQGPPIDQALDEWRTHPEVVELINEIAPRRVPVETAEATAVGFIAADPAERERRASLLFAGLFDTLNQERGEVIAGLERLTRRQREFVRSIEADAARLRALQKDPGADPAAVKELTDRVTWQTRIFEERRRTIRYVCEVPVLIEKRLFVLGRAMQGAMQRNGSD
ncbi:hypothetical protein [Geminicoccus flavidas]|uniref:hypothetical protein n=1 Tax=Geminicoccus flavidas TaxID=2506407 RepID=UPI00135B9D9A|nr:hypothetical protein [Geminicoccus flavidas]